MRCRSVAWKKTRFYNASTTPLQRFYNASTTLLQRFCITVGKYATLLQRFFSASAPPWENIQCFKSPKKTTLLQHFYNASTTLLQRFYNASTTLLQRFYNASTLTFLLFVDSIPEGEMIASSPLHTIGHQRLEFSGGFCSSVPHHGVHKTEWWTPKFSGAVFRSPCN